MGQSARRRGGWRWAIVYLGISGAALPAWALDIDGVQPAALDQPRVNVMLLRPGSPKPLVANVSGTATSNVEAFLDTGASGVMLSIHSANLLGIQNEKGKSDAAPPAGDDAQFEDVGVGGATPFAISEPVSILLAPSDADVQSDTGVPQPAVYTQKYGPLRTEVGPLSVSSDLIASMAISDLDVVGMPVMMGKVVVMDMTSVNKLSDKMSTTVLDRRSPQLQQLPIQAARAAELRLVRAVHENHPGRCGPRRRSRPVRSLARGRLGRGRRRR